MNGSARYALVATLHHEQTKYSSKYQPNDDVGYKPILTKEHIFMKDIPAPQQLPHSLYCTRHIHSHHIACNIHLQRL